MHRKMWAGVLSTTLLFTLAACGGGTSESVTTDKTEPTKTNEPAKTNVPSLTDQAIKLVLVSDGGEAEGAAVIAELQQKFPKWTFEFINADEDKKGGKAALINAGQQMDIDFDSIGSMSQAVLKYELQEDIGELLKKHGVDLNRFDKTMIEAMRQMTGYVFGLPVSDSPVALYYNKDLFDKFGVSYPKDGMTWDEIVDMAKKLTRNDNGKMYYGLSFSETRMLASNQYSLSLVDPKAKKPTINSNEGWSKLAQSIYLPIRDIPGYKEARVATKKEMPSDDDFYKGEVAMTVYNLSTDKLEKAGFQWDMVAVPQLKDKKGVGFTAYPTYYSVIKTSKNKDAAIEVIKYLTSDEYQMAKAKKGTTPTVTTEAVKKALGQETKFKDKNWNSLYINPPAPIAVKTAWDKAVEKTYRTAFRSILFDGVDVNTAFRTAEEAAAKEIK